MNFKSTYIVVLYILLVSGVSAKIPKWVKENSHPNFSSEEYFMGIGISEDRTEAEDLARANLIKEITIRIESSLENTEVEIIENSEIDSRSEIVQKIKTQVSANLVGVQIAEIEREKGNYYALAVLSKLKYYTTLEIKMDELGQRIKNLMNDSRNLQEDGFLLPAIKNYQDSKVLLAQYIEKSSLYTALRGSKYNALENTDSTSIQLKIQKIVTNTELSILKGNNQTSISGSKLPEAIVVKAIYKTPLFKEVPAQNIPIQIKYENGDMVDKLVTGVDGKVRVNVTAIPTDESGRSGKIILKPLFEKVKRNIPTAEIFSDYKVETTKVTFRVKVDNLILKKKITAMVAENGYNVSKNADYTIVLDSSLMDNKEIDSPFGKIYMAKVSANINIVDRTNKTIASMKTTGKATDKTEEKAQSGALEKIKLTKKQFIALLAQTND